MPAVFIHVCERGTRPASQDKNRIVCFGENEKQYRNSIKSIEKNRDKMADNRKTGRKNKEIARN
jgi:hypothetical protein